MSSLMPLFAGAEEVAAKAAAKLIEMQSGSLRTERKDLLDIVTEADLASEAIVISGLRKLTPGAAFLAEESGASGNASSERWIIDPLDGTINYARGLPWFSVTIAYEVDGKIRLGLVNAPKAGLIARYVQGEVATIDGIPARVSETRSISDAVISIVLTSHFSREDVYRTAQIVERLGSVARGVRIVVSGALDMSLVASGRLDGFISFPADIVSHAAATPLIRAGGGQVTTLAGMPCKIEALDKIASNGLIHDELLSNLREALS